MIFFAIPHATSKERGMVVGVVVVVVDGFFLVLVVVGVLAKDGRRFFL